MATSIATQAILASAEKGLNSLLKMDHSAFEQLANLAGKVLAIESTAPNYTLIIIPTEQGLYLSSESTITPDIKITAPAALLLQLLLTNNKRNLLANANIMLVGDPALAYAFCKILDELNPDWQHELSQWFGPTIANFMVESVKMGNQQLQTGFNFAQQQMSTIFATVMSSFKDSPTDAPTTNPITKLINSLQSKFGQS